MSLSRFWGTRFGGALMTLSGLVLVVACSSGSAATGTEKLLDQTYANLIAARTSTVVFETEIRPTGNRPPIVTTETGRFDFVARTGQIDPAPGQNSGGAVIVGRTKFVHLGQGSAATLAHGKPWLALTHQASSDAAATALSDLVQPADASRLLYALRGLTSTITDAGTEPVDGSPTHHYRLGVDVSRVTLLASSDATKSALGDTIRSFFVAPLQPADLWIDRSGRPVRLDIHFELAPAAPTRGDAIGAPSPLEAPPGAAGGILTFTYRFAGFGVKVVATPPPRDQVYAVSANSSASGPSVQVGG